MDQGPVPSGGDNNKGNSWRLGAEEGKKANTRPLKVGHPSSWQEYPDRQMELASAARIESSACQRSNQRSIFEIKRLISNQHPSLA